MIGEFPSITPRVAFSCKQAVLFLIERRREGKIVGETAGRAQIRMSFAAIGRNRKLSTKGWTSLRKVLLMPDGAVLSREGREAGMNIGYAGRR